MYLNKGIIIQSGPIENLQIDFDFGVDNNPKPMVIVGKNGTGKSNFLSFVTDALIEIASTKFTDVAPASPTGIGHQWHRIIGGPTIRSGSKYELAILKFSQQDEIKTYISKGGQLSKADVADRIEGFPDMDWPENGSHKQIIENDAATEGIFRSGCYVSFPSERGEKAYWAAGPTASDYSDFTDHFQQHLGKPIAVRSTLQEFRVWLVDVLMDQMVDARALLPIQIPQQGGTLQINPNLIAALQNDGALQNINRLLGTILRQPDARVVRVGRNARSRKLMVLEGRRVLIPGFDAFSAGQAMLLSIFGTILRYADSGKGPQEMRNMEGIVVVDEVDAHLHADLQHDVLPALIALFPKIQFILTAHSPLFPLGMEKAFGSDGFTLIEFPSGIQITAERFGEFIKSFEYLKATKAFDDHVVERAAVVVRPLVLCEGQTDPKYLKTAAGLLGFKRLYDEVEFDWIGVLSDGQARDGGEGKLRQAQKILENNPCLLRFHTILLFDCEQKVIESDRGLLHVRVLQRNEHDAKYNVGIENLLPSAVFEDRFYTETRRENGTKTVVTTDLDKVRLCNHLCDQKREVADFERFRSELERIQNCLFP